MSIKVRIVAGDVDQADAAALAIGQVLTVTRESPPRAPAHRGATALAGREGSGLGSQWISVLID